MALSLLMCLLRGMVLSSYLTNYSILILKQSHYRSGGPEGSRKLRFPDFMTTAQDGGKVVSLTHRPPLPPENYSWYSFLLVAESVEFYVNEKFQ